VKASTKVQQQQTQQDRHYKKSLRNKETQHIQSTNRRINKYNNQKKIIIKTLRNQSRLKVTVLVQSRNKSTIRMMMKRGILIQ
jgi:hypothetical protein